MFKEENRLTHLPQWVIDEMVSYLYANGLVMKNKDLSGVVHVSFNVFPTPISKTLFEKIEFYQIAFNKIIEKMSRDVEFLHDNLKDFAQSDSFIKNFLEISKKASQSPHKQKIQLGIFRNDFMIDKIKKFIYQVEINTIASSMGTFSDGLKNFFSYFSKKYPQYFDYYFNQERDSTIPLNRDNVIDSISDSMHEAIKLFSPDRYKDSLVVFIIQEGERNEFDQRSIESQLWVKYNVQTRRLTLKQFLETATLDESNNVVIDSKIVSLFYFRSTYTERDFTDEECWKAREMIELSSAIKCPNVNTFLCTFKIFQYLLQKPEVLKKFVPEELIANDLSRFFMKMIYLNDLNEEEQTKLFSEIRDDVKKYVVKPQKEGGGNNYYNEDILPLLPSKETDEANTLNPILKSSLIMQRINPPEYENVVLHENCLKTITSVSEVSVYGIVLSDEKTIHLNKNVGFLLRTKDKIQQEGGVIGGYSAIDLPFLIDYNN